jgi:hypothetical protein
LLQCSSGKEEEEEEEEAEKKELLKLIYSQNTSANVYIRVSDHSRTLRRSRRRRRGDTHVMGNI